MVLLYSAGNFPSMTLTIFVFMGMELINAIMKGLTFFPKYRDLSLAGLKGELSLAVAGNG